jgi:hypothetical protein
MSASSQRRTMRAHGMVCILALSLAAACGGADEAAPADGAAGRDDAAAAPVLHAQGYGPVRLGMTADEARAAVGLDEAQATVIQGTDRCAVMVSDEFPRLTFAFIDGRLALVYSESLEVSTDAGLRKGDPEARLAELYPGPVEELQGTISGARRVMLTPASADSTRLAVNLMNGRVVALAVGVEAQVRPRVMCEAEAAGG